MGVCVEEKKGCLDLAAQSDSLSPPPRDGTKCVVVVASLGKCSGRSLFVARRGAGAVESGRGGGL